ncbi:MAG: hypothetical protein MJ076_01195 [Clostridia bacterium]|nr:hypothetical protein [Clostridia bacterium]
MTGYDIYKKAMLLLGYTDDKGEPQDNGRMYARALNAINQIGDDLCCMPPLSGLFKPVRIPKKALDAIAYGVGMLLSFSDGNSEKNSVLSEIYNAKRAIAKASVSSVKDVLPNTVEV